MDKDHFKYAFSVNTIGTEIPILETTNKTIAGAINEIVKKQPTPSPSIPQWKEVGPKSSNFKIIYKFIKNKYYRIFYTDSPSNNSAANIHNFFIFNDLNDINKQLFRIITIMVLITDDSISMSTNNGQILKLEELQE